MQRITDILPALASLGERQLQAENKASDLLESLLKGSGMPFVAQDFTVNIPRTLHAEVVADGKSLPCAGSTFASGVIQGKEVIISSAMPMAESPDLPNINVNPYCTVISRANHYRKPAVAVSHDTLRAIFAATHVTARVDAEVVPHTSRNFLLGNLASPATIVFTHYDSIGPGANDNASGVVTTLMVMSENPSLLENTLFVIAGAEELSDDLPYYWGAGYRRFQRAYPQAMRSAQQMIVIDSVGAGAAQAFREARTIRRAFPIDDLDSLVGRITLIAGDMEKLMLVYHSEKDVPEAVEETAVRSGAEMLSTLIPQTPQAHPRTTICAVSA